MNKIKIWLLMFVFLFISVVIYYQQKDEINTEQKIYIDSIIAAPKKDLNTKYEDYALYLPADYSVSKNDNSITYVISSDEVIITIDRTIKDTTDQYIEENNIKYIYNYYNNSEEGTINIDVWNSKEYENFLDVYIQFDDKAALAIIPDDENKKTNIENIIEILKSIVKV